MLNAADMDPEKVEEYLIQNPQFLDAYVTKNVDQEMLECWLLDRHKIAQSRKSSLSRWKFGQTAAAGAGTAAATEPKKNMLQELAKSLQKTSSRVGSVMWELAVCIASAVSADSFIFYLADKRDGTLCKFNIINNATGICYPDSIV
ncbi:cAMP and cAMP-inhibited cGMP 3',5'-cyclic phosphodiesterase 10A [Orchesella cincta]|uniref:cAMP and cAMP-inhibited cGMP 3',5'-cyclic phosphodiesterase 10A n=1 Tax=Orchesella cincta TaxID=48709 RepID=A0A1D2MKK4_ORCCI|nr:cAMP and cAMP-inhibited cGMP 3',5'-cyclic phosphodiesterase 10A [Orchesella cincta]